MQDAAPAQMSSHLLSVPEKSYTRQKFTACLHLHCDLRKQTGPIMKVNIRNHFRFISRVQSLPCSQKFRSAIPKMKKVGLRDSDRGGMVCQSGNLWRIGLTMLSRNGCYFKHFPESRWRFSSIVLYVSVALQAEV